MHSVIEQVTGASAAQIWAELFRLSCREEISHYLLHPYSGTAESELFAVKIAGR